MTHFIGFDSSDHFVLFNRIADSCPMDSYYISLDLFKESVICWKPLSHRMSPSERDSAKGGTTISLISLTEPKIN